MTNGAKVAAGLLTVVFAAGVTWGPAMMAGQGSTGTAAKPPEDPAPSPPPPAPRPATSAKPIVSGLPNVVLVFGCTVRKDQTALYGGPDTMPWLSELAAAGTTFDDALSVSSWTRASAVGVLTGRHPLGLGLPEPGPKQSQRVLSPEVSMLAEVLEEAGYFTYGITGNPNLNRQYGMAQGMSLYQDSNPKAFRRGRIQGTTEVKMALEALDTRFEDDRPFYLQMMLIDAHHPREPDPAVVARFQDQGVSPKMATYRASLVQLDQAFEQLDRGLAERGYTEQNTVFVFVADHGEGLDDPPHHGGGHGKKMYPTTVAIPWVVRGPQVAAGKRVTGLASGVDVLPTLTGLLGLDGVEEAVGQDLSAWVRGERTDPLPRDRAFAYSMFHRADVGSVWTPTAQCQDHFEHDLDRQLTGCFDRTTDPTFTNPVDNASLHAELVAWRARQLALATGAPVTTTEVDDDMAEQLRILGYAD